MELRINSQNDQNVHFEKNFKYEKIEEGDNTTRDNKGKKLDVIQRIRRCLFVSTSNGRIFRILVIVAVLLIAPLIITMEVSWESKIKAKYDINLLRKNNENDIEGLSVPSYVNLCLAYVANYEKLHSSDSTPLQKMYHYHREKKAEQNNPGDKNGEEEEITYLIERDDVCDDPSTPHSSLMTILASSWIDQIATYYFPHGTWNYQYRHNCDSGGSEEGNEAIQHFLPSRLEILQNEHDYSVEPVTVEMASALHHVCSSCFSGDNFLDPSCILFGYNSLQPHVTHHHVGKWPVLDFIQSNVEQAVSTYIDYKNKQQKKKKKEEANKEKNRVTIFLPCPVEDCHIGHYFHIPHDAHDSHNTLPIYSIVQNIPRHVEIIDLVNFTPDFPDEKNCDSPDPDVDLELCAAKIHALRAAQLRTDIRKVLSNMFPAAATRVYNYHDSATIYAKYLLPPLTEDSLLLCPVASISCILPALIRQQPQKSSNNEENPTKHDNTIIINSSSLYPYLSSLIRTNYGENNNHLSKTTLLSTPTEILGINCQMLRGRVGHWINENNSDNNGYTYTLRDSFLSNAMQFPLQNQDICPFTLVTKGNICTAMKESNIDRIMMVGDSLTSQQSLAFWGQLGKGREPTVYDKEPNVEQYRHAWQDFIPCTDSNNVEWNLYLTYIRNDRMTENEKECRGDEICMPWTKEYNRHEGRTLLVVNFGSHFTSHTKKFNTIEDAAKTFSDFWMEDQTKRANDNKQQNIAFFRSTTTGHANCEEKTSPFNNYEEFLEDLKDISKKWKQRFYDEYQWDRFPSQNRLTFEKLNKLPNVNIADVFYMSALRPNGHILNHPDMSEAEDCLNYEILPGTIDWWNHLWFSNFLDLEQIIF